ncbi:MAG TPA: hypothetical protein PLD59_07180 [Tepidisphaeraceae bacterium]|nr:hypothetical protein [Tepidisphaeraceae bacterium]
MITTVQKRSIFRRSIVVGFVVILAGVLAGCLKFPLGDPEKATIDTALVGDWFKRANDGAVTIWRAQPFDQRAYLVMQYEARPDGNGGWERGGLAVCKMWVTEVAGKSFACMKVLSEASEQPYLAFQYEYANDAVTIHAINADFVNKAGVTDAAGFEALVKANIDNRAMYLDPDSYEKATDADRETIDAICKAFH